MTHVPDISVVVPVYGSSESLPELAERLNISLSNLFSYELILVDDCGQAHSWQAIEKLALLDSRVRGIRLGRNFGQHAATLCGIDASRGLVVITMDEDLEHPPEAVVALYNAVTLETPVAYGVFEDRTHAWYRNLSSTAMRWTLLKAFPAMNKDYTSFRAIHHVVAKRMLEFKLSKPYIDGLISWLTSRTVSIPVSHGTRKYGESTYTIKKLLSHALNIFVTFSQLPLRFATYLGACIAAASFAWMCYVIFGRITGTFSSPGYASLMSVILFACGIQLTILGIVGEYIGKIVDASYQKPAYFRIECTD